MTLSVSNRIAWQYHSDNGQTYRVSAKKDMTDQALLGGEAWAGVVGAKPSNVKMRRITCSATGQPSRVVPVYSVDAEILTAETEILVNVNGTMTTLKSSGNPIPEGHLRHSVTKQSS